MTKGRIGKALTALALASGLAALAAWGFFTAVTAVFGDAIGAGYYAPAVTLCALDKDGSAGVIIAGDCRAKIDIDPAVIRERTGLYAVNAGEIISLGGDLTTFVNSLRANPAALASHPLIILSVTLRGMNDFSIENIPMATLWNWTLADHARVAARKPGRYLRFFTGQYLGALRREWNHRRSGDGFACTDSVALPPTLAAARGYRPYYGRSRVTLTADTGGWLLGGGSWRVFQSSLAWLAASQARGILIVGAPNEPAWSRAVLDDEWRGLQAEFSGMLEHEAGRFPKVRYLDFTSTLDIGLDSAAFYDGLHLNAEGAIPYSRRLGDYLVREFTAPESR